MDDTPTDYQKENNRLNTRNPIFALLTLVCLISSAVCVIVDLAITHTLTWSWYPLSSIAYAWLIFTPLLIKRNILAVWLTPVSIFVIPYLLLLERLTPNGNWFNKLALPIAIIGIVVLWLCSFIVKGLRKKNNWLMAAVLVFILCTVVAPVVTVIVFEYNGEQVVFFTTNFLYIPVSATISAVLCITGIA